MSMHWAEAGTLLIAGDTLEYACCGPPPSKAPTIVLLHEGLGCISLWRDVPAVLSDATGFGVFAYSRAGYGRSDPAVLPRPLNYLTREALDVLPKVLDTIGIQSAFLLGHSDGATIVAIHAGSVVDARIIGIVLIAPHFFTEVAGLEAIAQAKRAYDDGDLRKRMSKYHIDPDNAFRGWNDAWLDPGFKTWNVAASLDEIRLPVLAIQGREDPYGTLAQIDVITHRVHHAPVSTLILNQCKHAPHLERGPEVVATVTAFCQQILLKTAISSEGG